MAKVGNAIHGTMLTALLGKDQNAEMGNCASNGKICEMAQAGSVIAGIGMTINTNTVRQILWLPRQQSLIILQPEGLSDTAARQ